MSLGILTAVDHRHEADLVATLEGVRDLRVVRRCADVPELVSVAAAGVADVAIVSATFPGVERETLRSLAGAGVRSVGMCERRDEDGERRLRQLGVTAVVHPDSSVDELTETLRGDPAAGLLQLVGEPLTAVPQAGSSAGVGRPDGGGSARPQGPVGGAGPAADLDPDAPAPPATPVEERPHGRVLAVWGPIGSPGRTTVALTLAALLAERGHLALLVDADTWGASVGQALGLLDESPGLAAAARLSEQGALDLLALLRITPEVGPGLRVLTGLPRADRWPEVRGAAMTDILTSARALATHVVVDCGFALEDDEELSYDTAAPRRNAATLAVLDEADEVIVVGGADPVGLQRLVRGAEEVAGLTAARRTVVVNKVRRSSVGTAPERAITEVLSRFSGLGDLIFLPWAPAECDQALWEGRTLVDVAREAPLTTAVDGLLDRLGAPARPVRRRGRRRGGRPT